MDVKMLINIISLSEVKRHIFDHLKTDLDYIQLRCFTKKYVTLRKWVYKCTLCYQEFFEGTNDNSVKVKAKTHLSLCPIKNVEPSTKMALMDLRTRTDSHDIHKTYHLQTIYTCYT